MKTLKFNSQICTTIEQSKKLLELGLKRETADMNWTIVDMDREGNEYSVEYKSIGRGKYQSSHPDWYIPAWSLHRLIEIMDVYEIVLDWKFGIYECAISMLEERIKDGLVDKKYLKQ